MPEENHKWRDGILGVGDIVRGGAFQVKQARDDTVNNVKFVLYGIVDNLKCGTVYITIVFCNPQESGEIIYGICYY